MPVLTAFVAEFILSAMLVDCGSPAALVQMIRGGGKPAAMQSMLIEVPRMILVSLGSMDQRGATVVLWVSRQKQVAAGG